LGVTLTKLELGCYFLPSWCLVVTFLCVGGNSPKPPEKTFLILPAVCFRHTAWQNLKYFLLAQFLNNQYLNYGRRAKRKPLLLLLLVELLLLRLATRQLVALLFQLPPRKARLEPTIISFFLKFVF